MNRPYIFCHMMTSLGGKIMGNYMETSEGAAAGEVFYNISFGKNPYYNSDAWRWWCAELVIYPSRNVRRSQRGHCSRSRRFFHDAYAFCCKERHCCGQSS